MEGCVFYETVFPYFILGEIDPSDRKTVEGMEHFCTTAGVIHADYVVVQSEAMRQVYGRNLESLSIRA